MSREEGPWWRRLSVQRHLAPEDSHDRRVRPRLRLLVFHAKDQEAVLKRLWCAVAPGGHLVLHDYDTRTADVLPRPGVRPGVEAGRDVGLQPRRAVTSISATVCHCSSR